MSVYSCKTWFFLLFTTFSRIVLSSSPFRLSFSNDSYGADGPWPAVQLTAGTNTDASVLNLYPGGTWETYIIDTVYCQTNKTENFCLASEAGLYNSASRHGSGLLTGYFQSTPSWMSQGLKVVGDGAKGWVDQLRFTDVEGSTLSVPNVSISLIETNMIAYPGGQWYPVSAGCLSLGGDREYYQPQQVDNSDDSKWLGDVKAMLPTGYLWLDGKIPSNSFGMHIGSVALGSPKVPGSLWFGGYDKSRVTGSILSFDASQGNDFRGGSGPILSDIAFEVIKGHSPFNFTSKKDGLLATGNSSLSDSTSVHIDGCSPYLTLPKSTCDAIASWLPVNYDEALGLYLWDTKSSQYKQIISSAVTLSFKIKASRESVKSETFRVPFQHLNLTLSAPFKEKPTQYFPCFTGGAQDSYTLGRAFLQDVFLGANWDKLSQTWWLAQAPGPNLSHGEDPMSLRGSDVSIEAGSNAWEASWDGVWDESWAPGNTDLANANHTNPILSIGAKAGIGIGVGFLVISAISGVVFFLRRRTDSNQALEGRPRSDQPEDLKYSVQPSNVSKPVPWVEDQSGDRRQEVSVDGMVHEAPDDGMVNEAPAYNMRMELP